MYLPRMIAIEIAIAGVRQTKEITGWRKREVRGDLPDPVGMPATADLIGREHASGILLKCMRLIAKNVMAERERFGRKPKVRARDDVACSDNVRKFRRLSPSPHLMWSSGLVEVVM